MPSSLWRLVLILALSAPALSSSHATTVDSLVVPDFSGRWRINSAKSMALARQAKANTAATVFGDECVITQTADALTLEIVAGGLKVEAIYRLDGKPSANRSPGALGQPEIAIISTTRWVGDTLEIITKSESALDGVMVRVESLRTVWLTADGELAVERHGTPTRVVSDAWNVYQRVKAEPGKR